MIAPSSAACGVPTSPKACPHRRTPCHSDLGTALVTASMVFVGFGVVAPERKRDDYRGLNVKGKIVVVIPPIIAGEMK